jgi:hypothetical protein
MVTAHLFHSTAEIIGFAVILAAFTFSVYTFVAPALATIARASFVRITAALVALDAHIRRLESARAERRAQAATIIKAAP